MSNDDKDPYLSEEYQFLEEPELGASEEPPITEPKTKSTSRFDKAMIIDFMKQNSPARNALIVLLAIVFTFILYQFVSGLFGASDEKKLLARQTQPINPTPIVKTEAPISQPVSKPMDAELSAKLSALNSRENNMQTQFSALSNQVSGLNASMNALVEKMNQLSQQVTVLANTVQDQANTIVLLRERAKPVTPRVIMPRVVRNPIPRIQYYVEAVIPGRAWLIATNGSTLTVRVGSLVPGYGIVSAIDVTQGRVLMNSGQVIRFNQNDS